MKLRLIFLIISFFVLNSGAETPAPTDSAAPKMEAISKDLDKHLESMVGPSGQSKDDIYKTAQKMIDDYNAQPNDPKAMQKLLEQLENDSKLPAENRAPGSK